MLASGILKAGAQEKRIMILHTSDTHSCVEPVAANHSDTAMAGKAGFARRDGMVRAYRKEYPNTMLLLDCGDFSQGSVYYNLFRGEVEIGLMNEMGYDACTIGNHEFDYGMDNLARLMRMAKFPFVCCNYDFSGTPCEGLVKPYIVKELAGLRIGIFGVCPDPKGLVSASNYEGMRYERPAEAAQRVIDTLRKEERCDLIVCLSHLGWDIGGDDDQALVSSTSGIDILLGGHSHTTFRHPHSLRDQSGHEVLADHVGKNARFVGTVEVIMEYRAGLP